MHSVSYIYLIAINTIHNDMKKITFSICALALSTGLYAQKSDGTAKSLIKAEKEFSAAAKSGANQAFLKYATNEAIVFRPNAVNAKTYYATAENTKNLSWSPNFVQVSKSGDWGFTTGAYTIDNGEKVYGHYLTVWTAKDGKWQYSLDMGAESAKPLAGLTLDVVEPKGQYKPRLRVDEKDVKARKNVILTTEQMLNTLFKTHGANAFSGFLTEKSRLLFPGTESTVGKSNIQAFNNRMISKINLKNAGVDRANGDDLAYTYGLATIDYKGVELRESFNYIYVWERDDKGGWNLLAQIYTEAIR